jgi:EF hand
MIHLTRLAAAAALVLAFAGPALAQGGPPSPEQRAARFDAADANKDGKLDKAEWVTSIPEQMKANIDVDQAWSTRVDADGNGFITKEEYMSLQMRRPQ